MPTRDDVRERITAKLVADGHKVCDGPTNERGIVYRIAGVQHAMLESEIMVAPDPDRRCYRLITVRGIAWGRIHAESFGPRGQLYSISGMGPGSWLTEAKIPSDAMMERRRTAGDHTLIQPLPERLREEAVRVIAAGLLQHPDEVTRINTERKERHRIEREQHQANVDAEFRKMAESALGPLMICTGADDAIDRILTAMRWAQSR